MVEIKGAVNLTTGSPTKRILLFSLPIFIGCIFQQLYSLADSIIVGRFIGNDAYSGIGSVSALTFLVLGFTQGLAIGFSVLTSQYYGAKNIEMVKKSVGTSLILCLIFSAVTTALSLIFIKDLLNIMSTSHTFYEPAYEYTETIFWGITCNMFYNAFASMLRSVGDSKNPLYILILATILNIGLDLLFIVVFHWGVRGAGYATVISQGLSAIVAAIYMVKKYEIFRIKARHFKTSFAFMWKHLYIGLPMAFQNSIIAIAMAVQQTAVNHISDNAVTAYVTGAKISNFFAQGFLAIGSTMATYAGQNYGARDLSRIKQGIKSAFNILFIYFVAVIIITNAFSLIFIKLFISSPNAEVISLCRRYVFWQTVFYPALIVIHILRNTLQGMGKSNLMVLNGVVELFARIFCAVVFISRFGFIALSLSNPCAWIAADIFLFIVYHFIMKSYSKQDKQGVFGFKE